MTKHYWLREQKYEEFLLVVQKTHTHCGVQRNCHSKSNKCTAATHLLNQDATHPRWNMWSHGSRTASSAPKFAKHITHGVELAPGGALKAGEEFAFGSEDFVCEFVFCAFEKTTAGSEAMVSSVATCGAELATQVRVNTMIRLEGLSF